MNSKVGLTTSSTRPILKSSANFLLIISVSTSADARFFDKIKALGFFVTKLYTKAEDYR